MDNENARCSVEEVKPHLPTTYYIDFENVHSDGLAGINALPPEDKVVVFYSKKADSIRIESAVDVFSSAAEVQFVEADNGTPNALDFQLTTMLIALASPERAYVIVSADSGFDAVIKMANKMDLPKITRQARIDGKDPEPAAEPHSPSKEPPKPAPAKPEPQQSAKTSKKRDLVNKKLESAGVSLKQQQLSAVMNALNNTHRKQDFYLSIIRSEGQQPGLSLYRRVRDHYDALAAIVR